MWNTPDQNELSKLPGLYETEDVELAAKEIHLHFFLGSCDWYIAEYDGQDLFWGYAILNGDVEMAEWGYISFSELKELKVGPGFEVDHDLHWQVKKASEIPQIKTYDRE